MAGWFYEEWFEQLGRPEEQTWDAICCTVHDIEDVDGYIVARRDHDTAVVTVDSDWHDGTEDFECSCRAGTWCAHKEAVDAYLTWKAGAEAVADAVSVEPGSQ